MLLLCRRLAFNAIKMTGSSPATTALPPGSGRGMTTFDPQIFERTVVFPCIYVDKKEVGRIIGLKEIRKATIDRSGRLKPVSVGRTPDERMVLFNPEVVDKFTFPEIQSAVSKVIDTRVHLESQTIHLKYEDLDVKRCLRTVLPEGLEFSGYTQVGHIAHLNLREELYPYRHVIGQILLDKIQWIKTVVNKTDSIATEFRSFNMELLAGEDRYETTMHEQGLVYHFDFRRVFWNSRLSTEHGRIVGKLGEGSVVFDIFAGVGPFALPATKSRKVVRVFANDKNPHSVVYLRENIKLNQIPSEKISTYELDAADFISQVVGPETLAQVYLDHSKPLTFHCIMNLPALAVTFLPNFRGLLAHSPTDLELCQRHKFVVHCHMFVKATADLPIAWYLTRAEEVVREQLATALPVSIDEVYHVRKVAGRKEMICVSLSLPWEFLFEKTKNC